MKLQKINKSTKIHKNTPNGKSKKKKKRLLWIKGTFLLILTVTTLILLALSPVFNIADFEVNGSKHYSKSKIIDATGIIIGSNGFKSVGSNITDLFTFRYRNAEKEILNRFPYVKNVTVRFLIPNMVRININERKPLCLVKYHGLNLILDEDAYVLESSNGDIKKTFPLIKGLTFDSFKTGQALKISNIKNFEYVNKVIKALAVSDKDNKLINGGSFKLDKGLLAVVNQVDVTDISRVMILVDSRLKVNMGNLKDLDYKLTFFREILTRSLKKEDRGYLDMTLKEPVLTPDD